MLWVDGALPATSTGLPIMKWAVDGVVLGANDELTLEIVPFSCVDASVPLLIWRSVIRLLISAGTMRM